MKLTEQYTEIVGVTQVAGEERCYDLKPKVAKLEAENELKQIEIEGLGSQLLDVQQDCIALKKELGQLRVEGARADDC